MFKSRSISKKYIYNKRMSIDIGGLGNEEEGREDIIIN